MRAAVMRISAPGCRSSISKVRAAARTISTVGRLAAASNGLSPTIYRRASNIATATLAAAAPNGIGIKSWRASPGIFEDRSSYPKTECGTQVKARQECLALPQADKYTLRYGEIGRASGRGRVCQYV